jgi:hypothetical protein
MSTYHSGEIYFLMGEGCIIFGLNKASAINFKIGDLIIFRLLFQYKIDMFFHTRPGGGSGHGGSGEWGGRAHQSGPGG